MKRWLIGACVQFCTLYELAFHGIDVQPAVGSAGGRVTADAELTVRASGTATAAVTSATSASLVGLILKILSCLFPVGQTIDTGQSGPRSVTFP